MVTLLALTALPDVPDELVPIAVTQSPTETLDNVPLTVWVKEVEGVQLTVTCPLWFCTSIEVPVIAATVPFAPVGVRVDDGADPEELAAWFCELVDGEDPQAVARTTSAPSGTSTSVARRSRRPRRLLVVGSTLSVFIMSPM